MRGSADSRLSRSTITRAPYKQLAPTPRGDRAIASLSGHVLKIVKFPTTLVSRSCRDHLCRNKTLKISGMKISVGAVFNAIAQD